MDKGLQALERQKVHFFEEKVRLENVRAALAAEPMGVPKASGVGSGDDVLTEDTEEALRDKELVLKRMVAAKADANGKKLSANRVQEFSKLADETSISLRKRKCKKDESKRRGGGSWKMTTLPTARLDTVLLEPGWDSGRRVGYFRGTCEPSHDVGCDGNSGGLPKARGLAVGRTSFTRHPR